MRYRRTRQVHCPLLERRDASRREHACANSGMGRSVGRPGSRLTSAHAHCANSGNGPGVVGRPASVALTWADVSAMHLRKQREWRRGGRSTRPVALTRADVGAMRLRKLREGPGAVGRPAPVALTRADVGAMRLRKLREGPRAVARPAPVALTRAAVDALRLRKLRERPGAVARPVPVARTRAAVDAMRLRKLREWHGPGRSVGAPLSPWHGPTSGMRLRELRECGNHRQPAADDELDRAAAPPP